MHTHRGSHSFIIAVLAWVVLLQTLGPCASGEAITRPEKRLLLGAPYYAGYAPESNQIILGNRGGIHAFDVESGAERWSNSNGYAGAFSGRKRIVAWMAGVAVVLDQATGEEIWWCEANRYGPVFHAFFSPDETRIITVFTEGFAVHTVGKHTQRAYTDAGNYIVGWMPDNKTLLLAQGTADQYCWFTGKLQYMDVDTGAITDACTLPVPDKTLFPSLSSAGELAVPSMAGEGATGLKIFALKTGALVRELGEIPFVFRHAQWTADAKHLSFIAGNNSRFCLLNAETGAIETNLFREGDVFERSYLGEDIQVTGWTFSRDQDMNYWRWPLSTGDSPKKAFDGRRVAPGSMHFQFRDDQHFLTQNQNSFPDKKVTALYRVADRAKCAEWSVPIRPLNAAPLLTHSMTHYVDSIYDDSTAQTQSFGVYESGNDKPLCAGRGEPLALSDDGRFVAVKSEAVATTLYDTAQNKAVLRMAVENTDKNDYYQMTVAFSGDGQRMGIVLHPNLEVVTLTEGFPRRKMALPPGEDAFSIWGANQACCLCFSPDGTRLLSAGYGHAWLHDAATGALLHDFEETEEFTNQHQYSNGFLQEIANSAKDWAGMVTDRFKRSCQLEVAFSQNGAQVITLAAGQVIRVWDAASGKLLHTIHTELPEKRDKNGSINNCIRLSANGDYAFCFNNDNFGDASLWSLIDGTLIHRYQLPTGHYNRDEVAVAEDGSRVLIEMDSDIFQWPGKPLR